MLGQTGRLSERQRVKPRLSLPLIRIRYFVVSLIPWSEALSRPPSPQNTFQKLSLFSDVLHTEVSELICNDFCQEVTQKNHHKLIYIIQFYLENP